MNVLSVQVSMDALDQIEPMYHATMVRLSHNIPGFQGMMGLLDPETGEILSVALNDSEDLIVQARESEPNQEEVRKFQHLFVSEPQREVYRLDVRYMPRNRPFPGERAFFARSTTGWVDPRDVGKIIAMNRDSLIYAAIFEKGCAGFLLCSNRDTGKILGISMWESLEYLLLSESDEGYYHREMEKLRPLLIGPYERRVYRVFDRLMP